MTEKWERRRKKESVLGITTHPSWKLLAVARVTALVFDSALLYGAVYRGYIWFSVF